MHNLCFILLATVTLEHNLPTPTAKFKMGISEMETDGSNADSTVDKHQREVKETPSEISPPGPRGSYEVDESVVSAFPVPGTKILHALNYGMSLWGKTAKIIVELPGGEEAQYFLKVGTTCLRKCCIPLVDYLWMAGTFINPSIHLVAVALH